MSEETKPSAEQITPDYYGGHGYRGDGIHGCDVLLGGMRCGAGMFQHMWVTEYYSDNNDDDDE